jgi:hypothetical protein
MDQTLRQAQGTMRGIRIYDIAGRFMMDLPEERVSAQGAGRIFGEMKITAASADR